MNHKKNNRLHFEYGTVLRNMKAYLDGHNKRQENLTDRISSNCRGTTELMVRLYLKQLNRISRLDPFDLEDMPGFRTYNTSLAAERGCTARTIINHRERLMKANVIIKAKRLGADGLELWINPEIMFKGVMKAEISEGGCLKLEPLVAPDKGNMKNFPTLVPETQEQINNNSSVDKSGVLADIGGWPDGNARTGTFDRNTQKNTDIEGPISTDTEEYRPEIRIVIDPQEQKKSKETQKNADSGPGADLEEQEHTGPEGISIRHLMEDFVSYALKVLYPNIILCGFEMDGIKNRVWESVYKSNRVRNTDKEWRDYQGMLFERVDMVRRWLDRNPVHWIPEPNLYFYVQNKKNGFDKTWLWYLRNETLKLRIKNEQRVKIMKKDLSDHSKGKGRFKHRTRLQLFQLHKKHLNGIGDDRLKQVYFHELNKYTRTSTRKA